jgi:hypothetical protein
MTFKPVEECITVQELLADPERWTKNAVARNQYGAAIPHTHDPDACKWCLYGALLRVYGSGNYWPFEDKLLKTLGRETVAPWNDDPERTHAQVLEAVTKAGI